MEFTQAAGNAQIKKQCVYGVYVIPSKPMPFGKKKYLKALEERVANLESYLTRDGVQDLASDHWQYLPQPACLEDEKTPSFTQTDKWKEQQYTVANGTETASNSIDPENLNEKKNEVDSVIGVLRDLSLDANGGYMGATAHITLGRLVGSVVKGKKSLRASSEISSVKEHLSPSSTTDADLDYVDSAFIQIPGNIADRMLVAYMKQISTTFTILHSEMIRDLHRRRHNLEKVYEICTLHLIYAIGG